MGKITEYVVTNGFKVNYIPIDDEGTPIEKSFNDKENLLEWFDEIYANNNDKRIVYLMCCDGENIDDLVFVSQYKESIYVTIYGLFSGESIFPSRGLDEDIEDIVDLSDMTIFIQEYDSYEEAYKVALAMQEEHPFCYSEDKIPKISLN